MGIRLASPQALATSFITVARWFESVHLERLPTGNVAVVDDANGEQIGYVDLQTGNVFDVDGELVA